MAQLDSSSAFARALNRVLADDRFTVAEMAAVAECSDRHLYNVRAGEAGLSAARAERLARFLCRHGETRLTEAFVCPSYALVRRAEGTADGQVAAEIVRIVHALADADAGHGRRDAWALRGACRAIRTALADLEAEADALSPAA